MKSSLLAALTIFLSVSSLHAGSIQSGGGEDFEDRLNPWFLQNTEEVRYCIKIDQKNFGTSLAHVESQIQSALEYWKAEFQNSISPVGSSIRVGTQRFLQVDCGEAHDLAFQFGVLSAAQKASLEKPSRYIGVTVRESYDVSSLKAKGYIYLSPAFGDLKYEDERLIPNAWALHGGYLLASVLAHELGHVFGLPHNGGRFQLMGQQFPEQLLNQNYARWVDPSRPIPATLSLARGDSRAGQGQCLPDPTMKTVIRIFGLPAGSKCVRLEYHHQSPLKVSELRVFSSTSKTGPETLVATAAMRTVDATSSIAGVTAWLTPAQRVVKLPYSNGQRLIGPIFPEVTKQGFMICRMAECRREIFVRFESGSAFIGGVVDGQLIYDFFASSEEMPRRSIRSN